ncbi:hypothetical protein QOZ80_2BG0187860 [Eleusine coracana subsp. coracana]|nr:hypothetical protein QOZ80_2BG0187860 [Eleusine coracana subsp. coracana]
MAVQAHHHHHHQYYLAHASFPHDHDSRAIRPEVLENASVLLGAAAQQAVCGNAAFSDLTCTNNNNTDDGFFEPRRKRARVGDVAGTGLIMEEGHDGSLLPPLPAFTPATDVQQQSCRVLCSVAASTSGRPSPASGLLSLLYRHTVDIDALVRTENERLRAGLEAARRRHVRAVVSAVERAAAKRLRDAEAELERARARNAEMEERIRQASAEAQAWQGVARSHEAVAAGLRATIDQLLRQTPCAVEGEGDAEDAQSCCFEQQQEGDDARARACKLCGDADACLLLLPCRHLCLCAACEPAVDACPVCAATKNASLHVLLD